MIFWWREILSVVCWTSPETDSVWEDEVEISDTDLFRLSVMSHKTLQQIMLNIIRDVFTVFSTHSVILCQFLHKSFKSQWDDPYKENVFCFSMTVFGCTLWKLVNSNCYAFAGKSWNMCCNSTDLALSQYHLFSSLKVQLGGPNFRVMMRWNWCDTVVANAGCRVVSTGNWKHAPWYDKVPQLCRQFLWKLKWLV
jgi:hypothetical protein